jgi:SHS2 domain-containing protein
MGRIQLNEGMAIADRTLEVSGLELDDLFTTAARAVAETMVDPATVSSTRKRTVALSAPTLDLLFFDWLCELIFRRDAGNEVCRAARVQLRGTGPYLLLAELDEGTIEPGRTVVRTEAGSLAPHLLTIDRAGAGWRATFVLGR